VVLMTEYINYPYIPRYILYGLLVIVAEYIGTW
jgi:hypothetical protein